MAGRNITTPGRNGLPIDPQSAVAGLAEFFPQAQPVKITVRVRREELSEQTLVEFRTDKEVLFECRLPLEFDDKLQIESEDGSLRMDAEVVALQVNDGQTAVAARRQATDK
jgi:hypothetical protein